LKKNKLTDKNTQPIQPPNPTGAGKTVPPTGNTCSWETKYRLKAEDHTFKNCAPLKEYKRTGVMPTPSASSGKEAVLHRANFAQEIIEEDNGIALIVSSSSYQRASPLPCPASMAYTDTIYEVWIFNTGASCNITADFSHLHNPVHCHVALMVGGGRIMHTTLQGNVWLDIEVSSRVISITLTNVLYVPDWNEACLISWRKILK